MCWFASSYGYPHQPQHPAHWRDLHILHRTGKDQYIIAWQWHHMSVMASQVTDKSTRFMYSKAHLWSLFTVTSHNVISGKLIFVQHFVQAKNKKKSKFGMTSFYEGLLVDSTYKGPVIEKVFHVIKAQRVVANDHLKDCMPINVVHLYVSQCACVSMRYREFT